MATSRNYILDEAVAEKKLRRMALEILENNYEEKELIIAGIRENGSVIARNIQKMLDELGNIQTRIMNIALDKKRPGAINLSESFDFNDKVILLVDDVANSGKTLLYALKPFLEFQPKNPDPCTGREKS